MRLSELLQEAVDNLVKKFETLYDELPTDQAKRVVDALEKLQAAVAAKSIYNADFGFIKDQLARAMREGLKKSDDFSRDEKDWDNSPHMKVYMADISSHDYLNRTKGQAKKIKSFLDNLPASFPESDVKKLKRMLELNQIGAEINELLTGLKPHIQKGRVPKPADPNAFQRKMGDEASIKLVRKELSAGIQKPLDDREAAVKEWFQGIIDELTLLSGKTVDAATIDRDPMKHHIFQQCFSYKAEHLDKDGKPVSSFSRSVSKKTYEVGGASGHRNVKTYAAEEAKKDRESVERQYLAKNESKLSHIMQLKGNLDKIEELPYKKAKLSNVGTLETGFKFTFTDGSEFNVINKIVSKYSTGGRSSYSTGGGHYFYQFPTTFHHVKLPDGSKLSLPSEEKMVKEFAQWKPKT